MNNIKENKISLTALVLLFMSLQLSGLATVEANGLGGEGNAAADGGDLGVEADGLVPNNKFQHLLASLRYRRQVGPLQSTAQRRRQAFPLAQGQQQLFDDEQTIRNQLPDLIAQAHNDKAVERALLKMLINASLRSALSNVGARPQQQAFADKQWLEGEPGADQDVMARFSRLDQQQQPQHNFDNLDSLTGAIDSLTSGANANGASRLVQSDQYQQPGMQVDKREYIKPCSFNAVSCVRTPFRKL